MQNNHYSIIHPFVDSSMIEKQQVKALGLSVHQERLRQRINGASMRYEPSLTAACTAHSSPLNLTKENISPVKGIPAERSRINWIKFNILVSIYQNWLRLEPFIRYWLSRTYQKSQMGQNRLWPFLRKRTKEGQQSEGGKHVEAMDILDEIRLRRDELLKGLQPSQCDIERLGFARQLARQLLSTLPLQNNKWSKMRIQKQNRLLDEMINNFNEEQFQMNSDAIMHSIKQRIYFIDEMQKKFIDISKDQKNKLEEKLELLKLPFKKVFNQTNKRNIQPEALFQSLWQEIESERSKLLTIKPQLRHSSKKIKHKQRYAIIQKSQSQGLVVKYQLKHADFYNDSYIRSHSKTKKLKRKTKTGGTSINDTLQSSKVAEVTKDSVDQLLINEPTDSNISQSLNEKDQEEVNAQYVEDFMRRQKLKPTYRDQTSTFFKKTPTKFENSYSHYRPSISYVDGRSNKDTDLSAMRSGISIRERTSVFARRSSRRRPSGEEITEKEDHMSRFRSHKKLITLKNIGGGARHTKLKEQSKKESQLGTISRISERFSKMQRREYRKEPVDYRKGVLRKKGVNRREAIPDEEIIIVPENLLNLNRQEFLSYFNKILAAGHLDAEKYQSLKEQVKELVKKNEIPALQETHAYVSKLVEKSIEEQYSCLLGEGREQLLFDLSEIISNDERIRAKIREEMKIFFMESVEDCCSEDSICNEQFVYNTTELRKVNQELKRVICFRSEGESLSLAKRLIKESSILGQRSI